MTIDTRASSKSLIWGDELGGMCRVTALVQKQSKVLETALTPVLHPWHTSEFFVLTGSSSLILNGCESVSMCAK